MRTTSLNLAAYALASLMDVATFQKYGYVSLKSVADRNGFSISYLERIFATLSRANITYSKKGPSGGYALLKSLEDVSVGQIYALFEKEAAVDKADSRTQFQVPGLMVFWGEFNEFVLHSLDNITLADLLPEYEKTNDPKQFQEIEKSYQIEKTKILKGKGAIERVVMGRRIFTESKLPKKFIANSVFQWHKQINPEEKNDARK